jgi:SAM-dependent methyltransferase
MAVRWSGAAPGHAALDVCCGSGDLAFELARVVGATGHVTGLDFAAEMLEDAESRRAAAPGVRPASRPPARMSWVQGDALALPFPDASFDAATMGYGLRNVADIPRALAELARVLKPGASAAVLDFNNSEDPVVDGLQVGRPGPPLTPHPSPPSTWCRAVVCSGMQAFWWDSRGRQLWGATSRASRASHDPHGSCQAGGRGPHGKPAHAAPLASPLRRGALNAADPSTQPLPSRHALPR